MTNKLKFLNSCYSRIFRLMWSFSKRTQLKLFNGLKRHGSSIKMEYSIFESDKTERQLPPLIIMHGLLASRRMWRETAMRLESKLKRKVYSVDLRNHGDSPHTNEHTYRHMAVDLYEFMAYNNISKAMLMGDGMGGRVVMYFALSNPNAVERGVVLDVFPLSVLCGPKQKERVLLTMKSIKAFAHLDAAQGRAEIQRTIEGVVKRPELINTIMSNLRRRENGEFYWTVNIESLLTYLVELSYFSLAIKQKRPFPGPMMFFCDNYSEYITTQNWSIVNLLFPNSEINWLTVNQLAYIHQSEHFYNLIIAFLK